MSRVEYYDPDGLYPLIAPQLNAHLPLRNLHWSSASRPLRSIARLDVDFHPRPLEGPVGGREDGSGSTRRHQLAGLRATPLLKIFLLRCDDQDSYKITKRPLIREWLEQHVRPTSGPSTKQEKHDACEWLILHVVLPNTPAASQPRWTRSSGSDDEGTKEKSSAKRWPGKGSRGVFEKLRADFGAEKKSDTDHVAQIRLLLLDIPPEKQPAKIPGAASDYSESPRERENAWTDFLGKLKSFILLSFDLRVSQYEDDIHARDLQRNLPGWNFCTFFVLKEGLALTFESIGLLEDAMAIYDELELGFETVLTEQRAGGDAGTGKTFATSTDEAARLAWPNNDASGVAAESFIRRPLDATKRNYREMIAASNASVFDVRCYLCARQIALLLKVAKPLLGQGVSQSNGVNLTVKAQRDSWDGSEKLDEVSALAKVCSLGLGSITSLARLLRRDLYNHADSNPEQTRAETAPIEAIVAAWTYAACAQLIAETASFRIPEARSNIDENSSPLSTSGHGKNRARAGIQGSRDLDSLFPGVSISGNEKLSKSSAWRADICLLQRRIVERLATWHGWQLVDGDQNSKVTTLMEAEDSQDEGASQVEGPAQSSPEIQALASLKGSDLHAAASSLSNSRQLYEDLTHKAASLYLSAGRTKSVERLVAEIGIVRFYKNDYATAALYLGTIAAPFTGNNWDVAESRILKMYMACLKMMNRKDEYLRVGLGLLAKGAAMRQFSSSQCSKVDGNPVHGQMRAFNKRSEELMSETQLMLTELAEYSSQLTYDLSSTLKPFFAGLEYDRNIELLDDSDGFKVGITLRQLLSNEYITVDSIEARLISSEDAQSREINLESLGPVRINSTNTRVELVCSVSTLGAYTFDRLTIRAGRIAFTWEPLSKVDISTPVGLLASSAGDSVRTTKHSKLFCYPRPEALRVSLHPGRHIHIHKERAIELKVKNGSKPVQSGQISLKSGSAGLRLRTAEASVVQGEVEIDASGGQGLIEIAQMASNSTALITIPFVTEHILRTLSVRLEAKYTIENKQYIFYASFEIDNEIPIDVTVQDSFKEHHVFSRFLVKPVGKGPIRVLSAEFDSSDTYHAVPFSEAFTPATVFHHEPACLTYKISKTLTSTNNGHAGSGDVALPLTLHFRTVIEEIILKTSEILTRAVRESPYKKYETLFISILERSIRRNVLPSDLDAAGLLGEYRLPQVRNLGLEMIFEAIQPSVRQSLTSWLQSWRNAHEIIDISDMESEASQAGCRTLHIDFDVPRLQYLHTSSLQIDSNHKPPHGSKLQVGSRLPCTLCTRFTNRWDTKVRSKPNDHVEFVYTIDASDEAWAISGPVRAQFEALPEETKEFKVGLVPLQAGNISLPNVYVRPAGAEALPGLTSSPEIGLTEHHMAVSPSLTNGAVSPAPTIGSGTTGGWMFSAGLQTSFGAVLETTPQGVCETDCVTAGDTIQVVEGWRAIALGICDVKASDGDGEDQGQATLEEFEEEVHVLESDTFSSR